MLLRGALVHDHLHLLGEQRWCRKRSSAVPPGAEAVDEQGQSYAVAIRHAVEQGRITPAVAAVEMKELA